MQEGRREQAGEISLVLLAAAALLIVGAALTIWVWLLKAAESHLGLFDNERTSALYCAGPLRQVLSGRAQGGSEVQAFGQDQRCLIRRTDYAAPGADVERPPEILCVLLEALGLEALGLPEAGVGPCV